MEDVTTGPIERDAPKGSMLTIRGVTRHYATAGGPQITALDRIDLDVPADQLLAISGPSGSGKSTLLHLLGAMDHPDQGTITVDGENITRLSRRHLVQYRRRVGFVFQRFHLIAALTALDNVVAPVLPYHTDFDKRERARGLLAGVGLGERLNALPARLSGGEQQRVAIARALINDPKLLLADEPTGNLDSVTGSEVMDLIRDLREQRGLTVLVATHDVALSARCDRIVRLRDGTITDDVLVEQCNGDDLLHRLGRLRPDS
jgi:putative ABC transport system ATP-binding protein